jgi:hypothetical protein
METLGYTANFAIPMLGPWWTGTNSLALIYCYLFVFDFLNAWGHCNFEIVPYRCAPRCPYTNSPTPTHTNCPAASPHPAPGATASSASSIGTWAAILRGWLDSPVRPARHRRHDLVTHLRFVVSLHSLLPCDDGLTPKRSKLLVSQGG